MGNTGNDRLLNTRHNPVTFYFRTLLYLFTALLLRLLALAPLCALAVFPHGSALRWLALLCPALLIFLVLPLRFSFAQALVQSGKDRRFSFDVALNTADYGEKLGESLVHALNVAKWGIPLAAMLIMGVYFYYNTDVITLLTGLSNLGAGTMVVLAAIANFFIGIFGGTQVVANGDLMEGLYTVAALLGLGVLVLLLGAVRNSAFRYIWALAQKADKDPRAEARRRLRGHRWQQFGVAAINLVLWLPALYVTFTALKGVLSGLSDAMFTFVSTQKLNLPQLSDALWPLLFAFLICYMPLLPIRRILTAFFAARRLPGVPAAQPQAVAETAMPVQTAEDSEYIGTQTSGPFFGGFTPAYTARPSESAPVPAYRPGQGETAYQPYQPYRPQENAPSVEPNAANAETDEDDIDQLTAYREAEPVAQPAQPDAGDANHENASQTTGENT
ncbi:MAG TPA: hypothetical protein PKN45_00890 [Candidatus Limiplasma sp.]|nr:hypothetical protein [Candidatus Limiplasma sp.]HPR78561.1 hypothetical protein [Candidatus Limiplasma sp.]